MNRTTPLACALAGTFCGAMLFISPARADGPIDGKQSQAAARLLGGNEGGIAGGTGNGADVIVSGIGGTLTLYGTVSGVSGYSMTTVSCNLGEQDAIWIDTGAQPNRHPVIGMNLYRLRNGRFEQIGMSWLKHGFCAADASSCGGTPEPNGSCDWLGTFSTDTYSASLNGDQSNLGPRSEVNPWTGAYPYPPNLNWGNTGDAKYKRLQVAANDVNPAMNPGATYFGESQYICTGWTGQPGDEFPINRYNNVSYRPVNVGSASGTGWNLSFTGSTAAQQPAINAWGAFLKEANVGNDGRIIVGFAVSEPSPGVFHYEYAVYNMNSDRGVQAFSLPVASCLPVTNIGFHDVDYHSGEPYSGADWTATNAGGFLTWTTQTFAQNPNANALRWGSLYNFRFDTTVQPKRAPVTLTFFKPGPDTAQNVRIFGPSDCPTDMAPDSGVGDGVVDVQDLIEVINTWGACESFIDCLADVAPPVGNGRVDVDDLLAVLTTWGRCR